MSIFTKKVTTPKPTVAPAPQSKKFQLPHRRITQTKVLIPLNAKSRNGRIYTQENLQNAIDEFLIRKNSLGIVYGEFDPDTLDTSLSRVSHTVNNVWFENNRLMGEVTFLNTHWGNIAQELINDGIDLAVRPRLAGTIDENDYVCVEKLFTFDVLSNDTTGNNQELRRIKLERLDEIATTGSSEKKLPAFSESFFYLKKQ